MKPISLVLVALLAGCGNASDTRFATAFVATRAATPAAAAGPAATPATPATPAAAPPTMVSVDAFHAHVSTVVETPGSDGAEPAALSSAPISAPDDSEPAPL